MFTVSVLYPKTVTSRFDHTYYLETHVPMVESLWRPMGLEQVQLLRGTATLDGSTCPFELIGLLSFTSRDAMQQALAAAGAQVIADIPNFTDVQPLIQVNQPAG